MSKHAFSITLWIIHNWCSYPKEHTFFYSSCIVIVYHYCLSSPFLVCFRENVSFHRVIWDNKVFDNYFTFWNIVTNFSSWQWCLYLDNTLTTFLQTEIFEIFFDDFLLIFGSINFCKCCFFNKFCWHFFRYFLKFFSFPGM